MPNSYELIESIVDEMAPCNVNAQYSSPTVIAMRNIIREALKRYEKVCMEEAALHEGD